MEGFARILFVHPARVVPICQGTQVARQVDSVRKEVFFAGRVQGVGFRYTTCRIAERFDVSGTVRNLADGRVLLVVEGRGGEVDRFIDSITNRMREFITSVEKTEQPATHQFQGFSVRD